MTRFATCEVCNKKRLTGDLGIVTMQSGKTHDIVRVFYCSDSDECFKNAIEQGKRVIDNIEKYL